jgi:hypothetical protein
VTSVVDLAAPLLLGVGDGTVEGEAEPAEVLGVGVAADDVPPVGVGLAEPDPVGVADDELDGCVVAFRGELWPLKIPPTLVPVECPPETAELSGLPIVSSNTVMAAMMTRKNPAATPP